MLTAKRRADDWFIAWVALVVTIYAVVALQKIPHFSWTNILFGSGIVIALILPMKLKDKAYLVPLTLSCFLLMAFILIPIAGGTIKSLLFFCWIFILSLVLGNKALSLLKNLELFSLEEFILSIALGFGIISLLTFSLAITHLLYTKIIYTAFIAITVIFAKDILNTCTKIYIKTRHSLRTIQKFNISPIVAALTSIVLIMVFVNFLGMLAPENSYDGLNYHLTVPKFYIINHGIINLPNIFQSYFAKSIEMLYLLGLIFAGQITAKLFSFAFGILMILAIICIGKRFFSLKAGILGAILFYTCPQVGCLSVTVYTELAACFYIFTTLLTFLIWQENKKRTLLFLCGILAAFTLAVKLYAFLTLFCMGLLIIFLDWQYTKNNRKKFLLDLLTFVCPILVLTFPWFWVTYLQTGNPVFPFFNAIFKSSLMPIANSFMDLKTFGMGNHIKDFLLLPWNVTYHSAAFGTERNGSMGIVFLIALPAFFLLRKSNIIKMLVLISVGSIAIWFFIGQYARYLMPEFALFSLLAAYLLCHFFDKNNLAYQKKLQALLLIYMFFTTIVYLNLNKNIPSEVALGIESHEQYLTRTIRTYPAAQYLNKHYNPNYIKVFLFGSEDRYYIDAMTYNNNSLNMAFDFPSDSNQLVDYLRQKGITHVLVDIKKKEIAKAVGEALVKGGKTQIEFSDKNVTLYKIR
jgi:4-amino-4-deoxy-L-arabinose transferase-like glycosyltransferase